MNTVNLLHDRRRAATQRSRTATAGLRRPDRSALRRGRKSRPSVRDRVGLVTSYRLRPGPRGCDAPRKGCGSGLPESHRDGRDRHHLRCVSEGQPDQPTAASHAIDRRGGNNIQGGTIHRSVRRWIQSRSCDSSASLTGRTRASSQESLSRSERGKLPEFGPRKLREFQRVPGLSVEDWPA